MSELGGNERQLLAAARRALGPTPADRARLRGALSLAIATGAGPATVDAPSTAPPLGSTGTGAGWLAPWVGAPARWLAGGLLLGATFGGGFVAGRFSVAPSAPETAGAPLAAPRTPPAGVAAGVVAASATTEAPQAPPTAPTPETRAPSAGSAPPGAASSDPLAAELALVQDAQRALQGGDAAGALRRIAELDSRFPRGVLGEEREAVRVLAKCASLRGETARELGLGFARTYPASVYVDRVRESCFGAANGAVTTPGERAPGNRMQSERAIGDGAQGDAARVSSPRE